MLGPLPRRGDLHEDKFAPSAFASLHPNNSRSYPALICPTLQNPTLPKTERQQGICPKLFLQIMSLVAEDASNDNSCFTPVVLRGRGSAQLDSPDTRRLAAGTLRHAGRVVFLDGIAKLLLPEGGECYGTA